MTDTSSATVAALPALTRDLLAAPSGGAPGGARGGVELPPATLLALPERAVQFGTGAFLRGFVDFFVDAANRQGAFGGRVVAVGSTGSGRDRVIDAQDGLYTLVTRGVSEGATCDERRVVAGISRALSAVDEWDAVLAVARAPELALVFSNTTEVGIALDGEDAYDLAPPRSFPGKLTRFLHERALAFDYAPERGVVVLPCELIERNGARLREIVLTLAARWALDPRFAAWIEAAVPFCDTLVDRIVPGWPGTEEALRLQEALGYQDELLTTCEPYRLFAIQADDATRARIGIVGADAGIVVADDIAPYRERKVRLLNGAHTTMVAAAILAGCETVREAVDHPDVGPFLRRALLDEIVPTVDAPGTAAFAREVLDRFANPFIRHALLDITLQGTMKMRVRVVPTILRAASRRGAVPPALALGFAAHLLFLRGDVQADRRARGLAVPADDQAERIAALWAELPSTPSDDELHGLAGRACGDRTLWDADLAVVPGFTAAVARYLGIMVHDGMPAALRALAASPAPSAR